MTLEQNVEYLLSHDRRFEREVIYDTDAKGEDFCEMIIKNASNPSFPVTVTVCEGGCSVAVGQLEDVTGSRCMTPEQVIGVIDDIISDKIVFVLGYNDEGDIGFGAPTFSRVFALTGREDDMSSDYGDFIERISKPIKKFRFLYSLKGRFLIFNYSGSLNKTVER